MALRSHRYAILTLLLLPLLLAPVLSPPAVAEAEDSQRQPGPSASAALEADSRPRRVLITNDNGIEDVSWWSGGRWGRGSQPGRFTATRPSA